MIVAEANRIAVLNAASPRYGQCNRQTPQLFEQLACNVNFLWEGVREGDLFLKKRSPSLIIVPLRGAGNKCSAVALPYYFFYSALGSFAAGFISNAQMTIARIVFGSIYVPLYSTE